MIKPVLSFLFYADWDLFMTHFFANEKMTINSARKTKNEKKRTLGLPFNSQVRQRPWQPGRAQF